MREPVEAKSKRYCLEGVCKDESEEDDAKLGMQVAQGLRLGHLLRETLDLLPPDSPPVFDLKPCRCAQEANASDSRELIKLIISLVWKLHNHNIPRRRWPPMRQSAHRR